MSMDNKALTILIQVCLF